MNYEAELGNRVKKFESNFPIAKRFQTPAEALIHDAMMYSLNAGGKRIRPILLIEVAEQYGVPYEQALPFAQALEMIHTYSLVHDDLPCMDNDDLRRGKPTNHKVYGEDIAVLAGDGLLNLAAETMISAVIEFGFQPQMIRAMDEILKASGPSGMILGQVADMTYSKTEMDLVKLDYINRLKTGKLITAALVSGALLGNASEDEQKIFRNVGHSMGSMFQLVDDLLDLKGDPTKMGKSTQMDLQNKKQTYPILVGVETTERQIKTLMESMVKDLNLLKFRSEFLLKTIDFIAHREC